MAKRMLKSGTILAIVITGFILIYGILDAVEDTRKVDKITAIRGIASQLTGFHSDKDTSNILSYSVENVIFDDSTTPFLGGFRNNRSVWKLNTGKYDIGKHYPIALSINTNLEFNIYIDSLTEKLLKIEYISDKIEDTICPVLPASEAEKQILNMTDERYIGIPNSIPKITFEKAIIRSDLNIFKAQSILGQYIVYSSGNSEPRPVWIISFCGLPPPPIHTVAGMKNTPALPSYSQSRYRVIIDAESGRILYGTTIPFNSGKSLK